MRRIFVTTLVVLLFCYGLARADGPSLLTSACVSATTSATQIIAANQQNRVCVELNNFGAVSVACGDANVTSSRGSIIVAGSSKTYCVGVAVFCAAFSTTASVCPVESIR